MYPYPIICSISPRHSFFKFCQMVRNSPFMWLILMELLVIANIDFFTYMTEKYMLISINILYIWHICVKTSA